MFHRTLNQLFDIVELFEHERDVHPRPPRKPIALTVDAVLADQGERVGEQIERDGEAAAGRAHHRFMVFKRVVVFFENRHGFGVI